MSDRVEIPFRAWDEFHWLADDGKIKPGPAWTFDPDGLVYVVCKCGVILGSPKNHSIDADGTVNASIIDNQESMGAGNCGWHVFGRLLDWKYGAMPAGAAKVVAK